MRAHTSNTPPHTYTHIYARQVRELVQSFGEIKILELITDKETGKSKG